ncbi:MAG: spore protease YyaC [Lachnospiraceae bacterium]
MGLWEMLTLKNGRDVYYYDTRNGEETQEFASQLYEMMMEELKREEKDGVVVLCIGTDRSTGDSLGPLIGYKLKEKGIRRVQVIGTLERPVHAMNLEQYLHLIRISYPNHLVVAVDASVGKSEHVGYATLGKGSLKPGLGVCKELRAVGDIFITGIVGTCGNCDPIMLQSIRLSVVMGLADYISESIFLVEKLWDNPAFV